MMVMKARALETPGLQFSLYLFPSGSHLRQVAAPKLQIVGVKMKAKVNMESA